MRPVALSFFLSHPPLSVFFLPCLLSYTNAHFCYGWMWWCSLCLSKLLCSLFPTESHSGFGEWLSVMIGCLSRTLCSIFAACKANCSLIKVVGCMKYELFDCGPEECNANRVSVPQTALVSLYTQHCSALTKHEWMQHASVIWLSIVSHFFAELLIRMPKEYLMKRTIVQ